MDIKFDKKKIFQLIGLMGRQWQAGIGNRLMNVPLLAFISREATDEFFENMTKARQMVYQIGFKGENAPLCGEDDDNDDDDDDISNTQGIVRYKILLLMFLLRIPLFHSFAVFKGSTMHFKDYGKFMVLENVDAKSIKNF
uniref:Uncharacterized protein n=1 Tax=Glossina brevipalpis TaxID=37001 RepID=A0A1A9WGT0_9MUSC